ncbi:uncharacterized protein LOC143461159 [Clavelina lepadiformis]|uniref:uncharacterized protein LOC143461159 n=1 Tax=Clavelina lepadiformis TaxID=159417 RepID=UPI0040428BB8
MESLQQEVLKLKIEVETLTTERQENAEKVDRLQRENETLRKSLESRKLNEKRQSKAFRDLMHVHKLTNNVLLNHLGQCNYDDIEDDLYEDPDAYVGLMFEHPVTAECESSEDDTRPKDVFNRSSYWRISQRFKNKNQTPPSLPPPRVLQNQKTRDDAAQPRDDVESSSIESSVSSQRLRDETAAFSFPNEAQRSRSTLAKRFSGSF